MEKERYLYKRFGNQRPFSVPNHYFDNIAARILEKVNKQVKIKDIKEENYSLPYHTKIIALHPFIAAAMIAGVVFIAMIFLNHSFARHEMASNIPTKITIEKKHSSPSSSNDKDFNATADYLMIDKDDIYAYLAE